jgi:hypothetical protein
MRIRLSREAGRHVVLDRFMLEDQRLSFRAKGLLAFLLAHPGFDLSDKRALTSASLEGMDAVETALKELEEAGYLRRIEGDDAVGTTQSIAVVSPLSRIPMLEPQEDITAEGTSDQPPQDKPRSKSSTDAQPNSPAARIIARLNELRSAAWEWVRYTPLSAKYAKNVEHINGRLSDGFEETDLVLILEYLAAVDGGKEESRKYFDCVTPFNTKNFERNLAMARDWEARGRPRAQPISKHRYEQSHDPSIYDRGRRGGPS